MNIALPTLAALAPPDVEVTIVGYRASNALTVKIRNLGSASQTLALIVSTGGNATRIDSVAYSIDDDSQLVKDARARWKIPSSIC